MATTAFPVSTAAPRAGDAEVLLLRLYLLRSLYVLFFIGGGLTFAGDFGAIAFAPLLFIPIIPWRYVWRHYLMRPGDRWSARAMQE